MSEHERIFLSPQDEADPEFGREWCHDDGNWESPGVEFIRIDLHEAALAAARLAGKLEGLELAANWLRRQANAETKPEGRAAFIEAHNAIRTIIAEIEKGEGDMTLEEGVAALRKVTRDHGGLNFSVEDWKAERETERND